MFSLDVSHSEFNLNSINTDEAIFMDMILAPEVAPEMTHKSEDEMSKLIERLNKGKIIKHNEALHDDGAIVYSYVAGRPFMETVVAREGGCRTWSCLLQCWSQSHK